MADEARWQVHELRQYTLVPGRRDELIEIFDNRFIEGQEDVGMFVQGQFCDLDQPDRFVWLRSFPDLERRGSALQRFYGGRVWTAHKDAANATMKSWNDVLLLQPVSVDDLGLVTEKSLPSIGSTTIPSALISVDVYQFSKVLDDDTVSFFVEEVEQALAAAGSKLQALLKTHSGPNNFPTLPIREGEQVIVRVARFDSDQAYIAHRELLSQSEKWAQIEADMARRLAGPIQRLRLRPTARSRLR